MNPLLNTCDTTLPTVQLTSTEFLDIDSAGLESPTSAMNSGLTSSSFSMLMSHEMLTPYKRKGELESMSNHLNLQQPSSEAKTSVLNKRKATDELRALNSGLPNWSVSNKRTVLSGSSPRSNGVPRLSTQNKRTEIQSKSPRTSVSSKKTGQIEPTLRKSHSAVSRNQSMQSESSSDIEAEKLDPVRVKLRESLTAALALVSEQKAGSLDTDKTEDMAEVPTQNGDSKPATSVSSTANCNNEESSAEGCGSSGIFPTNKHCDVKYGSQDLHLEDVSGEPWKFLGQDFQSNPIFPGDDAPFGESLFLRDELLQGNGLSWAMDFDAQIAEIRAVDSTQRDELAREADAQEKEQVDMSPESVASRIESELFTLFGGVNKKYKEKGRSLLFNLKDRNNPELRERVMSGEIQPERLCSMTAEELASKELSQWRMAKAEELDHMKVLPESDVNVRRLVKKTHKGEYQVEFDQDVSGVEDVPTNVSVAHENGRRKTSGGGAGRHSAIGGAKEECTITIPGDGTDMLGLMVDDMGDLPPILSLDEFMDSLDKEPPFENLPIDSGRTPELDNNIADDGVESKSPVLPSKDPVLSGLPILKKDGEAKEESVQLESHVGSAENQRASHTKVTAKIQRASDTRVVAEQVKVESLWEGLLQLTLSSTAYVVAIYKSGEKASTRGWPSSFEIKGRVRLDAFDKFLQELPKSRTRSTMVIHFALAKHCTDDERCNLIDLIDSYVTDQRLGYAEPSPGVELYMCPPRSKTVDMIVKHLPKGYTEKLNDIDNGLIGILVWRKERIVPSVALPNPSSQPKHTTPVQRSTFGRQLPGKDTFSKSTPKSDVENDVDLPPGFGPPGGDQDDDDLPEFNFSASPNSSRLPTPNPRNPPARSNLRPEVPSSQLEQMRALIQKYGKSGDSSVNGIPIQPWNDDDDDDIPEWQPQTVHSQRPLTPPGFPSQKPTPPGFPSQKPTVISHVPGRSSIQRPVVQVANPSPLAHPSIAPQGTWRHPGPNRVQPGQPTRTHSYGAPITGHRNRDGRSSNGYSRKRGV